MLAKPPRPGRIDLPQMFNLTQMAMLAELEATGLIEQPTSAGAVSEDRWIATLRNYLPQRYAASSAFVIDADGRRSRQIDIVIYDRLYSPLLFPTESGLHLPAEAVYAIFEVKSTLTHKWILDAGRKAASVRKLRRTSIPVLAAGKPAPAIAPQPLIAGILAHSAVWADFQPSLKAALKALPPTARLDLGCVLDVAAFEATPKGLRFSTKDETLVYFVLRLLDRLRHLGTAPAADLMAYARRLRSFKKPKPA